jgi:hypothetical protein
MTFIWDGFSLPSTFIASFFSLQDEFVSTSLLRKKTRLFVANECNSVLSKL